MEWLVFHSKPVFTIPRARLRFFIITELNVAGLCAHIWLVLYHVGLKMIISTDTLVINKSSLLSLRE